MLAQLTAYTVNFSMCRPTKPTAPADFMPSQFGKQRPVKKPPRMTKKRRAAIAKKVLAMFGG